MDLSFLNKCLDKDYSICFRLTCHNYVPRHFHITEAAVVEKKFTDCGGNKHQEKYISLQIWVSDDTDHQLTSEKMRKLLSTIDKGNECLPVKIEYEEKTLGFYDICEAQYSSDHLIFNLGRIVAKCLAEDQCKPKTNCCNSNCC